MEALVKSGSTVDVEMRDMPDTPPGEVLIRIALAGLCRTDIYVAKGIIPSRDPIVLGHEFSGVVERVGQGVDSARLGQRVTVMPLFPTNNYVLPNGLPSFAGATMMGIHHDGAFSEYASVPASAVYPLPDSVTFMQGAYMEPIAASLAVLNAAIRPEQLGLIFGDNRISRLTERIMHAKGFHNLAVCDSAADLPKDTYDYIVETLASTETMQAIVRALKPGGRIILKSRQHLPVAFNINTLVLKDIALEAVSYGDFNEGIDLVASGKLKIDDLLGDVFPLNQFETVFAESERSESKKLFFSAVSRDMWDR